MKNQKGLLKSLINRLESLDTDWKENRHLFIVKHRRFNHFPTMNKLRMSLLFLVGGSLIWCIFFAYMSNSLSVFFPNFIVPIIIFSNLGSEKEMKQAIELGAIKYIVKADLTPDEVVKKINLILEK